MAIYTSIAELERRLDAEVLAGLADDANTPPDLADVVTREVINQAITDGADLIDSYLLGRVNLAQPVVQASLERINATLALYFLYRRRYVDDAVNPLAAAKEAVTAHLAAVASGQVKIVDGDEGTPQATIYCTTSGCNRVLGAEKLKKL